MRSFSLVSHRFWYLTYFFALPMTQSAVSSLFLLSVSTAVCNISWILGDTRLHIPFWTVLTLIFPLYQPWDWMIVIIFQGVQHMKPFYPMIEALFFFFFGGTLYYCLELIFRGHSHYSMILCGGLAFYFVSLMNRHFERFLHLVTRLILSSMIITGTELIFGIIFNLHLGYSVWDYSEHAIHYRGQICLTFSILWFFLSLPLFWVEKKIRLAFLSLLR